MPLDHYSNFSGPWYTSMSGNQSTTIALTPAAGGPIVDGAVYGVRNTCSHTDDVLKVGAGAVQALTSVFMYYPNNPVYYPGPYPASILKVHSARKPWAALTEGYSIMDLMSRFGADTRGRSKYFNEVFTKVFQGVCPVAGTPIVPLDVPNLDEGNLLADFVSLRNNPLWAGLARIHFGLRSDDWVQIKVFDVTGREIRVLADRQFKAGEHDVVWDGTDNAGRALARGVYFTRVRYRDSGFAEARKVAILK